MIVSFADKATADVYHGHNTRDSRRVPANLHNAAFRKLVMLNNAQELRDLASPPANRLEMLKGNRQGRHSTRINDQWRIVFAWANGNASGVEIVDYH